MAVSSRFIVANWSSAPPATGTLFVVAAIAAISYFLLPTIPPWRDPDPRYLALYPSDAALLVFVYVLLILAIIGLSVLMRIHLAWRPPIHWWALPGVMLVPAVWIVLSTTESAYKAWGNMLELPLLGLLVGMFLALFGGSVRSWRAGIWWAWFAGVLATGVWVLTPRWA